MTRRILIALIAWPLAAHMVSVSTGDLRIDDDLRRLHYELRLPLYEVAHIGEPERSLFEKIGFSVGGEPARLVSKNCHRDPQAGEYVCQADYELPRAPGTILVECAFHRVTVPNHVHLLRAYAGGRTDQAVFDYSFERAELRFQPPSTLETTFREVLGGALQAAGSLTPVLLAAMFALASRSRRELGGMFGAFVGGQASACIGLAVPALLPPPRFVEAAAALALAYLGAEVVLLPKSGRRWVAAVPVGIIYGLYFLQFARGAGYGLATVEAGAVVVEAGAAAVFAWILGRVEAVVAGEGVRKFAAGFLAALGLIWFLLRVTGR